jgi:glutathione S-transferase
MLKILGRESSINVRKVLWTCAEIGRRFEREDWGTGFRPTSDPSFLALNPQALVPVIVDGDLVLNESNTICRYLATEAQRSDLLPATPRGRAQVERWMDWQATELNNAWRHAFLGLVRKSPAHQDPDAVAASAAEWNRQMSFLDRQLAATQAFAVGATFTLADVVLGLSTHRWMATPIERPALRHVEAYQRRLSARPAFRQSAGLAHP